MIERLVPPYTGPAGNWEAVLRDARVQRRRARTRIAAPVVAAAAVAAALALPLSPPTTIDKALAAAGNGRILHLVFESDTPKTLVNLETGAREQVRGRHEVWFDPAAGMRERETFAGVLQWEMAAGAADTPAHAREIYSSLLTGYRDALRDGTARVVREEPDVVWIRIARGHDVAVSRKTYTPIDMRIGDMHNTPIVTYETVDSAPLDAQPTLPQDDLGAPRGTTTLDSALLGRPPVWLGETFDGRRRGAVRRLDLPVAGRSIPGLAIAYEDVELTMAASPADGITMLAGVRDYVPPEGTLLLAGSSGLLRSGGLIVSIHSPDELTTLAVARALRPYPG